jgi:hypothetical protein
MRKFKSLEDFTDEKGNLVILKDSDTISFGENLSYTVRPSYLYCIKGGNNNSEIFKILNITDNLSFCTKYYGYDADDGYFPESESYDFEALTRVAIRLMSLYEEKLKTEEEPKKDNLLIRILKFVFR